MLSIVTNLYVVSYILTPGGFLVFGGAPKVGKSDFILSWLAHMAAGEPFLGMKPPRPLKIFYCQSEIHHEYLRERTQDVKIEDGLCARIGDHFMITPQLHLLLNEEGVEQLITDIREDFPQGGPDIIAIDPLRNVFDGGAGGENDNAAMMSFLTQRVQKIAREVNPNAAIILVHHTRKLSKEQFEEDPFQALSGASAIRGFYSSGMLLFRPDETRSQRHLHFELRNGPGIPYKRVDKINAQWIELEREGERISNQKQGKKQDAERDRKGDIILQLLYKEARQGRLHTSHHFAEKFDNKKGLGAEKTIRDRIAVLATQGYIKFIKEGLSSLGYPHVRSAQGLLCVQGMEFRNAEGELQPLFPTHYRSEGVLLLIEDPTIWETTDE